MLLGKDQDQGMLHTLGKTGEVLGEGNCDQKVVKSHHPFSCYLSLSPVPPFPVWGPNQGQDSLFRWLGTIFISKYTPGDTIEY